MDIDRGDEDLYVCERCHDTGWVVIDNTAYHCDCYQGRHKNSLEEQANVPERYSHCSFLNYHPGNNLSLAKALKTAEEFVKFYPAKRDGLLFMGGCGVGKTHLCVAIINELIGTKSVPCLFVDFRGILEEIKETYGESGEVTESDILEPVLETEVVVLDDLGAERTNQWVLDRLGFIINYRYSHKKTMIVTTNFLDNTGGRGGLERRAETLQDRIGVRLRSRLYEMCRLVEVKAPDYRHEMSSLSKGSSSKPKKPRRRSE